ncbi:chemotaxis protein CheW [bacterium]|nr:chemotaxis protein CheW [bacterium]
MTFRRGEDHYAVDVEHVRRVAPCPSLRPLPAAPPFVAGGGRFDGQVEAVLDPAALLAGGVASKESDCVVLVRAGGAPLGLLADVVHGVQAVDAAEIRKAPPFVSAARRDAVAGVFSREEREVLLLDLSRLLTSEERAEFSPSAAPNG